MLVYNSVIKQILTRLKMLKAQSSPSQRKRPASPHTKKVQRAPSPVPTYTRASSVSTVFNKDNSIEEYMIVRDNIQFIRMRNRYGQVFLVFTEHPLAIKNDNISVTHYAYDSEDSELIDYGKGVLHCMDMSVTALVLQYNDTENFVIVSKYKNIPSGRYTYSMLNDDDETYIFVHPVVFLSDLEEHPTETLQSVDAAFTQIYDLMVAQDTDMINDTMEVMKTIQDDYLSYIQSHKIALKKIREKITNLKAISDSNQKEETINALHRYHDLLEHMFYQNRFVDDSLESLRSVKIMIENCESALSEL